MVLPIIGRGPFSSIRESIGTFSKCEGESFVFESRTVIGAGTSGCDTLCAASGVGRAAVGFSTDVFDDLLWVPLDPLVSSESVVTYSRSEAVVPVSCLCILMLLLGVLPALLNGKVPDSLNVRFGISRLRERDL